MVEQGAVARHWGRQHVGVMLGLKPSQVSWTLGGLGLDGGLRGRNYHNILPSARKLKVISVDMETVNYCVSP